MLVFYLLFTTNWFLTDPRELSTVKSMEWILSGIHMLQTRWSTVPTKSMVCWFRLFDHCKQAYMMLWLSMSWRFCYCCLCWYCSRWHVVSLRTAAGCCSTHCSLWSEVVVCTVLGSVILPHTGANCTSDCLAHGWAFSSTSHVHDSVVAAAVTYFQCIIFSPFVVLWLLKIPSDICPFMTTNTFATSLGTTKGLLTSPRQSLFCNIIGRTWKLSSSHVTLFCVTRVTSLSMSPVDDTFISGSLDKTIRLWDLRSPNCQVSPSVNVIFVEAGW